jgi:hypothetical protein
MGWEDIPLSGLADLSGPAVLSALALLAITDKIVWHTRLRRIEAERDHWRDMALRLLGVSETLTVQGEVTNDLLTKLPDPAKETEAPR